MASQLLGVKIAFSLFIYLIAVASAYDMCLYKCKDPFGGDEICITEDLQCNNFPDCHEGEDEQNCGCDGFTCKDNGMCFAHSFRCNGHDNCFDKSDEENCTKADYKKSFPSLPDEDLCKKPCGYRGSCFFGSGGRALCRCDDGYSGIYCEIRNVTTSKNPPASQVSDLTEEMFACDRTEISKELFCDGKFDCADKSDESNCNLADYKKAKPHVDRRFLCLMPCQRTLCAFDNVFNAMCPCPEGSDGVFCEILIKSVAQPPASTAPTTTITSVTSTSEIPDGEAKEVAEESSNFFTTIALPIIAVAGLALALWLWISKPWATGGAMGRPLV